MKANPAAASFLTIVCVLARTPIARTQADGSRSELGHQFDSHVSRLVAEEFEPASVSPAQQAGERYMTRRVQRQQRNPPDPSVVALIVVGITVFCIFVLYALMGDD